jgi:hypothetical protein
LVEDVHIQDCRFDGTGLGASATYNAVELYYAAKSTIDNVGCTNFNGACVNAYLGMENSFTRLNAENCGGVLSGASQISAFSFDRQTSSDIGPSILALRSNGIGIEAGSSSFVHVDGVLSQKATILAPGGYWSGRGLKFKSLLNSAVSNFGSLNNGSTGVAVVQGSQHNTFSNGFALRNENFSTTTPDGNGWWSDGNNNSANVIVNFVTHSNQLNDISLAAGDNGNVFRGIDWDGKLLNSGAGNTVQP